MTKSNECQCDSCKRLDELIGWCGSNFAQTDPRTWNKTELRRLLIDVRALTRDRLELHNLRDDFD